MVQVFVGQGDEFITGKLFDNELIEWFVRIELPDDVIAILVCIGSNRIVFGVAIAVRITRDIQPMTSPPFTISR